MLVFFYDFECGYVYDYECPDLYDYECPDAYECEGRSYMTTNVADDYECRTYATTIVVDI